MTPTELSPVTDLITDAVAGFKTEALVVLGICLGLALMFFLYRWAKKNLFGHAK